MQIDIPPPTILKPQRLWTGKQIFNVLMRPNRKSKVFVNVECKCNKVEEVKKEGVRKAQTFKARKEEKEAVERQQEGWRSRAFDALTA